MTKEEELALQLDNQMCFPLYAASKKVINKYRPLLENVDLTYTQYITMMVMRENETIFLKQLGDILYLDSGTLTPVVKKLEERGFVKRVRVEYDERNVLVTLTNKGRALKEKVKQVPFEIIKCFNLSVEEAKTLYNLLHKILAE
ncbi:MAG: MarR family transcriptional regulator [Bacilli bacterium]|nr:MarR family transcriptional regulator [Bacilli bacterium]